MINPWVILGVVLSLGVAFATGYGKGRVDGTAACDARVVKLMKDSQDRKDNEAVVATKAADKVEKGNAQSKIIYRDIVQKVDKIVERPVYRNVCLDPDGLRSANAALAGQGGDPAKPDQPVPGLKPADGRLGGIGLKKTGGGG